MRSEVLFFERSEELGSNVQQLFMNQHFRDGILRFNSSIIEDKRESVLYQLQNMFVWLQHSHRKAYLPVDFCHAFKDWDGNPTNLYVQQDADEFLKRAFDQIEGLLNQVEGLLAHIPEAGGKSCSEKEV